MLTKISFYSFHILLLLIVFNSSFKYIYSSNIWNLFQVLLVFFIFCINTLNTKKTVSCHIGSLIIIFTLSFLTLASFFYKGAFFNENDIFKHVTLILLMFCGSLYGKNLNVIFFVKLCNVFLVCFILTFNVFKLAVMDPLANYLMYSMAIAFVGVANIGISYYKNWSWTWLIAGLSILLFCLTLHSRSAILLTIMFLFFFIFIYHFKAKKMLRLFILNVFVILLLVIIIKVNQISLNDVSNLGYGAYKLLSMFSGEYSDDRGSLLSSSLLYIADDPLGYGIGSYWSLIGYYPHNFFVEVILNFGFIVFLFYFIVFVIAVFELTKTKQLNVWFYALLYLYYLAVWMTSFDYLSSFQIHFAFGAFVSSLISYYSKLTARRAHVEHNVVG